MEGTHHHVTQRGNRRPTVFFSDDDYRTYKGLLADAHRRYSWGVNFREGWRGYLWQGRFASTPMDDSHLMAVPRYVELNPVRARLAASAGDWQWSSAQAKFLAGGLDPHIHAAIQSAERTGRPLGDSMFAAHLEQSLGRTLTRQKPGRKPKVAVE